MWFLVIQCVAIIWIIKNFTIDRWFCRKGSSPPEPKGLPFIGHVPYLKGLVKETGSYGRAWCRLAEEFGPVVKLRLGWGQPLIIVSGRKAVLEMLNRQEFDGRPNGFIFRHRTLGERRGVIFTDGAVWTAQRRFTLKTLKNFGFGKSTMENMITEDAIMLAKKIENIGNASTMNDFRSVVSVGVLNGLWALVTGSRFDLNEDDGKLIEVMNILNDIMRSANVTGGILNIMPFLRYVLPGPTGYTTYTERLNRIWAFFADEVTEHKKNRNQECLDLVDAYLQVIEMEKHDPSSPFDELQLVALIKDLFSAGVETTSNSIGFVISHLIARQDVQRKIHEELDSVIGRDSLPTLADKIRLPYLNATIMEVVRVSNVGPSTVPHRAMCDATLLGFDVPKNSSMLANLMSVHMDKNHFGDPENFRPERFINANGQFIDDPWIIPFGAGRRRCLGENLARNSLFIFIVCMLQKLQFSLHPDEASLPCLNGQDGFTVSPPDFRISITPRF